MYFLVQKEEAAVDMEFNLDPAIAELKEQEPVWMSLESEKLPRMGENLPTQYTTEDCLQKPISTSSENDRKGDSSKRTTPHFYIYIAIYYSYI